MKQPEYKEGLEAQQNFEEGMKALFKVPKVEVVKAEQKAKRKPASRAQSVRKPRVSDKDWNDSVVFPRPCRYVGGWPA